MCRCEVRVLLSRNRFHSEGSLFHSLQRFSKARTPQTGGSTEKFVTWY